MLEAQEGYGTEGQKTELCVSNTPTWKHMQILFLLWENPAQLAEPQATGAGEVACDGLAFSPELNI